MNRKMVLLRIVVITVVLTGLFPSGTEVTSKGQNAETDTKTATAEAPAEIQKVLELLVINKATKEPLPDVKLNIRAIQDIQEGGKDMREEDVTDENGRCKIELGTKKLDYVRIEAAKENFVPIVINWGTSRAVQTVPTQYTLELEPGTSIGGIIQDEQGEPIEGASVYLLVPGGNEFEQVALREHQEKTDADGHWRCDIVPSELQNVIIRLAHPDYINDDMYGQTQRPPMARLRDMTGVMVMKKGINVGGRVTDSNDQPIEGASVAQGSDRFGSHYPDTKTDNEGRFIFENTKPGEMILTVKASGYSPDLRQFVVSKDMPAIEFSLEKGRTIKGRIIDIDGNPVAGAFVAADTWRGNRSLMWRVDTDADGRFQWNEAPADEVLIDMGKQHYMSVRGYGMSASDQEYVITMHPELKVQGQVLDAETGRPISSFKVMPGIDWGNGREIYWQRGSARTFTQGRYETTFSYPRDAHLLRVEAEGYDPGTSRPFISNEGEVIYDFKLEKGTGPTGFVRLPDGGIAEGAEVILCTPSQSVYIENGRNRQRRESQFIETKQDGKFSFPSQTDPYLIMVLHDEGYAQVLDDELTASSEITLQPWAKVEAKVMIGNEPGKNVGLRLIFDGSGEQGGIRISQNYSSVTDSNGNCVFDRVSPGSARIYREIRVSARSTRFSHGVSIEIKPGQTHQITIGGIGRPVTGNVNIPDYLKGRFSWEHIDYSLEINSPDNPYTQLSCESIEEGAFRIEDVPAGQYCLNVSVYGPPADPRMYRGERIGMLSHPFVVSEMAGGRSDESLDLGILELEAFDKSAFIPSLIGKTLPGLKELNFDSLLPDTKSKTILVCFFDMQQRPSRNCLMQLSKKAQELMEKDVSIVAVQTSKLEQNTLNEWIKEQDISIPVGMIQDDEEQTKFDWGVKSLPWLILTDAEHVVTAEGFSISELDQKIKERIQ